MNDIVYFEIKRECELIKSELKAILREVVKPDSSVKKELFTREEMKIIGYTLKDLDRVRDNPKICIKGATSKSPYLYNRAEFDKYLLTRSIENK